MERKNNANIATVTFLSLLPFIVLIAIAVITFVTKREWLGALMAGALLIAYGIIQDVSSNGLLILTGFTFLLHANLLYRKAKK